MQLFPSIRASCLRCAHSGQTTTQVLPAPPDILNGSGITRAARAELAMTITGPAAPVGDTAAVWVTVVELARLSVPRSDVAYEFHVLNRVFVVTF